MQLGRTADRVAVNRLTAVESKSVGAPNTTAADVVGVQSIRYDGIAVEAVLSANRHRPI